MGACISNEGERAPEIKTIEDTGLLVFEFGDLQAPWTDAFPDPEGLIAINNDPTVRVSGIDSRHKSGYTPLSGIRLAFTNGTSTEWFETTASKQGPDAGIDELCDEVDTSRDIREVSLRLSPSNAICAMKLTDEKGDDIADIEWENFDLCREWKAYQVPEGHDLIGLRANTIADTNNITRLAFVFRKRPEK